ncbi:hypothetical protein DH2020_024871 [Rehmannia glutinosa]|uniref:Uncharacterized protein n=1 Tax=Rehmannia glutinosa TaxID=99300 RepID=A0ABR0W209_REHGL
MEDNHMEENEQKLEKEVAPALIAVHPNQLSVTVSIGSALRVFNLQDGSGAKLLDENGGHKDSIRAIRYSKSGRFFVSAGDDKLVKFWDTNSWHCFCSVVSEKRVTSLAISNDEMFVCFADKFGMVYVVDIRDYNYENQGSVNKKAVPILSHYCSIITRLVRLWDYASGTLLDTCDVGAKAGLLNSNQGQEEMVPAVTDLCAASDGSLVAVAIQSLPGIMLLSCNLSARTLSIAKVVAVKGETFIPTSIGASFSIPLLWMVMGASSLHNTDSTLLARVRVISGFGSNQSESVSHETSVLEDTEIPGGEPLLKELQGKLSIGEEAFSTAAEAVKTAMRNLLIKKNYSAERREVRKKGRNDKKNQSPA